jgi:hypothetical protein
MDMGSGDLPVDIGVRQGFGKRFDHEIVRTAVPALAEFRASHAGDDHFVLDAACHMFRVRQTLVAFQK